MLFNSAGCDPEDAECSGRTQYAGIRPSSLLALYNVIVGLASSALLPLLGAVVDHTSGKIFLLFELFYLSQPYLQLTIVVCVYHQSSSKIDWENFSHNLLCNSLSHDLSFGIHMVRSCNFINYQCLRRLDPQRDVICILTRDER